MMNIIIINSSLRKNGTTAKILHRMEECLLKKRHVRPGVVMIILTTPGILFAYRVYSIIR